MVLDLWALEEELEELARQGRPQPRLLFSERAHLILPHHREREEREGAAARLGTTKKGIGPAYADRAARKGLRLLDLFHPEYAEERLRAEGVDRASAVLGELLRLRDRFAPSLGMLGSFWSRPSTRERKRCSKGPRARSLTWTGGPTLT